MNRLQFLFAALTLMLFAAGCQNKNSLEAPRPQENEALIQEASPFAQNLEAEIRSLSKATAGEREISGPTVIAASGVYRVVRNFSATADAIVIRADRVVLELGRHVITGPGNKAGRGIILEGANYVLVRGGVLQTFGIGAVLANSAKSIIKNVHVRGGDEVADPPAGNPPQIGILLVDSHNNLVQGNAFTKINLGLFVRGGGGRENHLIHNSVVGGNNGLLGICYNPADGAGPAGPMEDRVAFNSLIRFGTGIQTSAGSASNRFTHNTIYYFNKAWEDFNGTNVFSGNRTLQVAP